MYIYTMMRGRSHIKCRWYMHDIHLLPELARDVKAAKRVEYKERDRVPGLVIQRGCTMRSVSWIPVIPSPIACRTRARTNITEGTL